MVVYLREQELMVGTHGRGVYIVALDAIQEVAKSSSAKPLVSFELQNVRYMEGWKKKPLFGDQPAFN
jgi:hypothetical protein